MLAYAANRPQPVERRPAPHAMLAIIALHVGLLAVVMSARMDLPQKIRNSPLVVDLITEDDPPPPNIDEPRSPNAPAQSQIDRPRVLVPAPPLDSPRVDADPAPPVRFEDVIPPLPEPGPRVEPSLKPPVPPVRVAAQLATPAARLRPPYPASKLASGEEATLRLRLSIDATGRVTAVEPVGRADRAFLEAARRHVIAQWRYKPATEDGRTVATTTVVTLRFVLEG